MVFEERMDDCCEMVEFSEEGELDLSKNKQSFKLPSHLRHDEWRASLVKKEEIFLIGVRSPYSLSSAIEALVFRN